jgi:hypothetical protein
MGAGVSVGVGVTAGAALLITTPLLQTNFFPFLIQVYSLPAALLTCPAFLHVAPALTAALEIEVLVLKVKRATNTMASDRFIR